MTSEWHKRYGTGVFSSIYHHALVLLKNNTDRNQNLWFINQFIHNRPHFGQCFAQCNRADHSDSVHFCIKKLCNFVHFVHHSPFHPSGVSKLLNYCTTRCPQFWACCQRPSSTGCFLSSLPPHFPSVSAFLSMKYRPMLRCHYVVFFCATVIKAPIFRGYVCLLASTLAGADFESNFNSRYWFEQEWIRIESVLTSIVFCIRSTSSLVFPHLLILTIPSVSSLTSATSISSFSELFRRFRIIQAGTTFIDLPRFSYLLHPLDFFVDLQLSFLKLLQPFLTLVYVCREFYRVSDVKCSTGESHDENQFQYIAFV
jgi:hypothetical protein